MSKKSGGDSRNFSLLRIILILIFFNAGVGMLIENPVFGLIVILLVLYFGFNKPIKEYFNKQREKNSFAVYEKLIGAYRETPLDFLAESCGITQDKVVDDLNKMLDNGYFSKAFIDFDKNVFIVPRNKKNRKSGVDDTGTIDNIPCPYCGKQIPRTVRFCFYCGKSLEVIADIEKRRLESNQLIRETMAVVHNDKVRGDLACIGNFADDILKRFEEEPQLIDDQYKFLEYYLPKTVSAIRNYKELCTLPNLNSDELGVKKQIEDSLDTIETAFSTILKKISIDGVYDLSADVSTLNTALAQEGLTESDFDVDLNE